MRKQAQLERELRNRRRQQPQQPQQPAQAPFVPVSTPALTQDEYIQLLEQKQNQELSNLRLNPDIFSIYTPGKFLKNPRVPSYQPTPTILRPKRPRVQVVPNGQGNEGSRQSQSRSRSRSRSPRIPEASRQRPRKESKYTSSSSSSTSSMEPSEQRVIHLPAWEWKTPEEVRQIQESRTAFCNNRELFIPGDSCKKCSAETLPKLLHELRSQILDTYLSLNPGTSKQDLEQKHPDESKFLPLLLNIMNSSAPEQTQKIMGDDQLVNWQKECRLLKSFVEFPTFRKSNPTVCGQCAQDSYQICMRSHCHTCPLYNDTENPIPEGAEKIMTNIFRMYGRNWKRKRFIKDRFDRLIQSRIPLRDMDPVEVHQRLFDSKTPSCSSLLNLQNFPNRLLDQKQSPICIPNSFLDPLLTLDSWTHRLDQHIAQLRSAIQDFIQADQSTSLAAVPLIEQSRNIMNRTRLCNLDQDLKTKGIGYVEIEKKYLNEIYKSVVATQRYLRCQALTQEEKIAAIPNWATEVLKRIDRCPRFDYHGQGFQGNTEDVGSFLERFITLLLIPPSLVIRSLIERHVDEEIVGGSASGAAGDGGATGALPPMHEDTVSNVLSRQSIVMTIVIEHPQPSMKVQDIIRNDLKSTVHHTTDEIHPDSKVVIRRRTTTTTTKSLWETPYLILELRLPPENPEQRTIYGKIIPEKKLVLGDGETILYLIGVIDFVPSYKRGTTGHWVGYFLFQSLWYYYDDQDTDPGWDVLDFDMLVNLVASTGPTTGKFYFYSKDPKPYYKDEDL